VNGYWVWVGDPQSEWASNGRTWRWYTGLLDDDLTLC
jgi:hypothetical protein